MWYINSRVESLPLTDMRYINGWVESSPSPQGGGLFCNEDRQMKKTGFYIIKDKFFEDMSDPYLKEIRQKTDHIIIALKIRIWVYTG